jgi:hypothetical protein
VNNFLQTTGDSQNFPEVISEGLGPLNPSMSQEEYFSV